LLTGLFPDIKIVGAWVDRFDFCSKFVDKGFPLVLGIQGNLTRQWLRAKKTDTKWKHSIFGSI
jgi:hypothetical protein